MNRSMSMIHFLLLGILFVSSIAGLSYAQMSGTINYQGYLTGPGNVPVNTPVQITFSIYDTVDPLVTLPLWSETHISVAVNEGVYSVVLGSVDPAGNPLNLPFDAPYYLGVKVGADAEMTPRQELTGVGYSFRSGESNNADTLDNQHAGSFAPSVHNHDATYVNEGQGSSISNAMIAAGAVTDTKISGTISGTKLGTHAHAGADISTGTVADARIASTIARDSEIMPSVLAGDGSGSGVDADMVDSKHAADLQNRVTGACPAGQAIRTVNTNGTVVCEAVVGGQDGDWTVSGTDMSSAVSGNVGIGSASPSEKLEVAGNVKLSASRPALVLNDTNGSNDRPLITILNNSANFDSDDRALQDFNFYSLWSSTRNYDARINIYGQSTGSWGHYLSLTHDGADGKISTDTGNLLLSPAGSVAIGKATADEKLDVAGNIQINSGEPVLVLKDTGYDGTRPRIRFLNNQGNFDSDDARLQNYGFYSIFAYTRSNDASLRVYGKTTGSWGRYTELTHDGSDAFINTDTGDIIMQPTGHFELSCSPNPPYNCIPITTKRLDLFGNLRLNDLGEAGVVSGQIEFPDGTKQSSAAMACWDLNGDGVKNSNEDINLDGSVDVGDCRGPQGVQGIQGPKGDKGDKPAHQWSSTSVRFENPNGTWGSYVNLQGPQGPSGLTGYHCWDLDMDRVNDALEDTNHDGQWNVQDCGTGVAGFSCWDTDMDRVNDPSEDVNGDGNFDTLDCQGQPVSTVAVCANAQSNTSCGCSNPIVVRTAQYSTQTGQQSCTVTSDTGSCTGWSSNSSALYYGVCCVCAP